jgi:hypothetical protein
MNKTFDMTLGETFNEMIKVRWTHIIERFKFLARIGLRAKVLVTYNRF